MSTEESDEPRAQPLPREGDVWYVSYGSNMSGARLTAYLEGGVPPGGTRANPGARDDSPPRRSVPVDLPGALYFAGRLAAVARRRRVLRPRRERADRQPRGPT